MAKIPRPRGHHSITPVDAAYLSVGGNLCGISACVELTPVKLGS
jgi:hypothetical protein